MEVCVCVEGLGGLKQEYKVERNYWEEKWQYWKDRKEGGGVDWVDEKDEGWRVRSGGSRSLLIKGETLLAEVLGQRRGEGCWEQSEWERQRDIRGDTAKEGVGEGQEWQFNEAIFEEQERR